MRILVLQFLPGTRQRTAPRFEPQLAGLLSLLRLRGHELDLVGLTRHDLAPIKAALARNLPNLIYADIHGVCADLARRTFQHLQEREFLPIVAGGQFATLAPHAALSLPGVVSVAVGEPDASLVTYFERLKDPAVGQTVLGVWMRDEAGSRTPAQPELVEDLDSLPLPERALFRYDAHVRAGGELEIVVGRGCPQRCGYCPNPTVAALYQGRGQWVRRRTPGHVLAELTGLRRDYPTAQRVRFLDHAFTLDAGWLTSFLAEYPRRCALPFRCHVRANALPDVAALVAAGCTAADVEIISGSDFVRNEVFAMDLSNDQIEQCCASLRAAGVALRAIVYLGAPYDSEISLAETSELLRRLRPAQVDARPFYPWPGTAGQRVARENGWLDARGEERIHRDETGIHMPACRPELVHQQVRTLRREFRVQLGEPWWRRLAAGWRARGS